MVNKTLRLLRMLLIFSFLRYIWCESTEQTKVLKTEGVWFRKRSYKSSVTRWEAEKFAPNSILHVTVWWKAVENMVNHVYELKKWMENSRPLKVRPRARGLFIFCLFRRALSCCRKITLQQHSKECCCKALIKKWL